MSKSPIIPIYCLLLLLVFLAHAPALDNGFIEYDDPVYVTENPHVRKGITTSGLIWAFSTTSQGNWHPLTWMSHMLVAQVHGLKPFWHHFHNLLLHACNVLLLFLLLKGLTGAMWRSAAVAALFAVHPVHVESVAWISERKDVLSTFFALLCLQAYALHAKGRGPVWYVAAACALALGLMAKPMLVTLPLLMLLLDFWPLGRFTTLADIKSLALEKLPFIAMILAFSIVSIVAQDDAGAMAPLSEFGVWQRTGNVLTSYVAYLGKLILPVGLAPLYPLQKTIPLWKIIASGLTLVLICGATIRMRKRVPWLFTGWYWYLVSMLPVIGIVQIGVQSMADRYTYLPLIGLYIAVVWGGGAFFLATGSGARKAAVILSLAAILAGCVWLSRQQAALWHDTVTLFEHTLEVTEQNRVAHKILGKAYLKQRDAENALRHYRTLLELRPDDPDNHFFVANTLFVAGRPDKALEQLSISLERFPDSAMLLKLSGVVKLSKDDMEGAKKDFERAHLLAPNDPEAARNLDLVTRRLQNDSGSTPQKQGKQ